MNAKNFQKEMLDSIFNSTSEYLYFKNIEGIYLKVSNTTAVLAGCGSPDMMEGKNDFEIYSDEIAQTFVDEDNKVISERTPISGVAWVEHPVKGKIFIESVKSPVFDSNGSLIGIFGVSRDITERCILHKKLKEKESQLNTIINNMPYSIWLKDKDDKYVLVNKEYENFYGIKNNDIQSQNVMATLASSGLTMDNTISELSNTDMQVLSTCNPITKEFIMKIKGEDRYVKITKTPIIDAKGNTLGLLGVSHDITEKKLAHQAEKQRVEEELQLAKAIQFSTLPRVFPPYPERCDFDIYASMKTAKEVGGDFYDFFFIDDDHLAFVIADVSGKGIPAAMFMMTAKTILKNFGQTNIEPECIMERANNTICQNNDKGFFMTAALGVLNLKSGELTYVNAGHNPPLIKKSCAEFEYLNIPVNIALGIFENVKFKSIKLRLQPTDTIFMYTDGVTEAFNTNGELYGENRLKNVLEIENIEPKKLIEAVTNSVEQHSLNCEQSDDITMLALRYLGTENFIREIHVPAEVSELKPFIEWVEKLCDKCDIPNDKKSKLLISAEEIFVNIAYYAYPQHSKEKIQETTISFKFIKYLKEISITFTDAGIQYNPLENEEPDITQNLEERVPGGLGILMVKKMMNSVEYDYQNKKNILTITILI